MLLSAIFLTDVGSVNNFQESQYVTFTQGDQVTVYIQLRDMSVFTASQGYKNPGRRYMPATGASLICSVPSLNPNAKIAKIASQPFPQDPSIWSFTFTAQDAVYGTQDLLLTLTENGVMTKGMVPQGLRIYPATPVPCATP